MRSDDGSSIQVLKEIVAKEGFSSLFRGASQFVIGDMLGQLAFTAYMVLSNLNSNFV